jgi:hypothetical protein
MKKKVFFQISVILYIALALFLAIIAACVYVVIEFFTSLINNATALEWGYLVAAVGGFIFMAYTFIRLARNRIILNEMEIFVPENWGSKDHKIQYETHISYAEIKNIFIIYSDKNSLNKTSRWVFTPMPYIVFECENDKQKAINVFYYSKKQVVRIIDEAVSRAKNTKNNQT